MAREARPPVSPLPLPDCGHGSILPTLISEADVYLTVAQIDLGACGEPRARRQFLPCTLKEEEGPQLPPSHRLVEGGVRLTPVGPARGVGLLELLRPPR